MTPTFETNYVRFITTLAFLFFCWLMIKIGLNIPLAMKDSPELWFQRSGSLITLVGVLLEYHLVKIRFMPYSERAEQKQISNFPERVVLLMIVIGTIIWGYGDLLFPAVTKILN